MRHHKYRAQPTEVDGHRFDSKAEARAYAELKLRERAGEIRGLMIQPEFPITIGGSIVRALPDSKGRQGRPLTYRADFAFFEGQARKVVDVKGMDTPVSRIKRAIVQHIYGVDIEVWR